MPDLALAATLLIPVSVLVAAGMAYHTGRLIERAQQADSGPDADVTVEAMPDHVIKASVTAVGGERTLVIVDDGRPIADAKRAVEDQIGTTVDQVDRVKLFEFDDDHDVDQQDRTHPFDDLRP